MKNIVLGILAHVDAGKTTLTEAMLLNTGVIKSFGRVDYKNTFLDNNELERERGITIFSKQAYFSTENTGFDLIDTPGHVDFSAELERTLSVLDYAVLVISGADEIFGHTMSLWKMLNKYNIPTFIFINKMDLALKDKASIMNMLRKELDSGCVSFYDNALNREIYEEIAVSSNDEILVDYFLTRGELTHDIICRLITERKLFPVYFGSAIKQEGVEELLIGLDKFSEKDNQIDNGSDFSARVYKITRDKNGERLTHLKILSGILNVKDELLDGEKVNQIRLYNGERYDTTTKLEAGRVCTVTGIEGSYAGQGIGNIHDLQLMFANPVLEYDLLLPSAISKRQAFTMLKQLEEELPELKVVWDEKLEQIKIRIMGQVQIEILTRIITDRFNFVPEFGKGKIAYKETIRDTSIGVGHFEPLRHYAEVHLLMEPGERGSGIYIDSRLSEDILDKNWQRLVMTHLKERTHRGVLCGLPITDVRITLINGKAHNKHTEGGDFRQATYRAVRQGLMENNSILLEPYYDFTLDIPSEMIGRAMTDIEQMHGVSMPPEINGDRAILTGFGPVATMRDYQINLNAYTHGKGSITVSFRDYNICHNQDEIVEYYNYNPDMDNRNPSASVFCAHGSGFIVPWHEVKKHMHLTDDEYMEDNVIEEKIVQNTSFDYSIGQDEIDAIINKTYNSNTNVGKRLFKKTHAVAPVVYRNQSKANLKREKLLLVDGYNVIFAWDELKDLAKDNIDSAKDKLIQILSNYQGINGAKTILVFDGYKVKGNTGSYHILEEIEVIHTKEDITADRYIEQFTNENSDQYDITVVTSDGLIQLITRGHNCYILSSKEFKIQIDNKLKEIRDEFLS